MDEMDAHLRNIKVTVEKIRNLETENFKEPVEKPKSLETQNFKDIIQRLRNLQTERKSLLLEIEELKKMAEAKANALESEVNALREEVNSLKILMTEAEPSVNKRKSESFKGNLTARTDKM
jgi:seryl-tRNA synthetase